MEMTRVLQNYHRLIGNLPEAVSTPRYRESEASIMCHTHTRARAQWSHTIFDTVSMTTSRQLYSYSAPFCLETREIREQREGTAQG